MPLAPALLIPFAEAVGLSIAGLGAIEIGKKVQDFIEDNPEISMDILTSLKQSFSMTVPGGVGLNTLFKDKDAPSTKDIVLGELEKEKGNYSDPDAEGAYSSKRGRIIKALEKAGKIKKGPDKDYDPDKKYKDYKKFYEKADGGAIGIEVLFEEKKDGGRIGYQSGGGLMDIETEFGLQAPKGTISFDDYLGGLYNSNKVGALQNQAVKDYALGDYTKTATGPISDFRHQAAMNELSKSFSPGLVPNIIGDTIAFGAGLINEIPSLGRGLNRENLREIGEDIVSNFKGTYGTSNKRTPEEIYDSIFNPKTTVVSSPNLTYGTAAAADFQSGEMLQTPTRTNVEGVDIDELTAPAGPSPFLGNADYQGDPNAIQRSPQGLLSKAIEGTKNVFGSIKDNIPNFGVLGLLNNLDRFDSLPIEDRQFILDQAGGNRPSKDRYGINRRSAFGNYADYVRNKGIFAPGKRGEYYRSLNIPGLDTAMKETVAREQRAKRAYEQQIRDAADAAAREQARIRSITAGYGGSDDSRGATGPTASGAGMGVGGGYASDYGFAKGGLATMFVEKR